MKCSKKHDWAGLDVGKERFFAALDLPSEHNAKQSLNSLTVREFKRTEVGCASFLKWLANDFAEYSFSVVMETTGCYSIQLSKWLQTMQPDMPVTVQNCRQVADFIKSLNMPHKTDQLDARAIARFGTERTPEPMQIKDEAWLKLKEFGRERSALVKVRTALELRKDSLNEHFTRKINGRVLAALTMQITVIEKEMEKTVKQNQVLWQQAQWMISAPGVSMISACGILAELGSLKQYSSRQLSALSGLVPRIHASGSSVNKSTISRRGSGRVRQLLYMDSLTAIHRIPELKALQQRIIARGKSKMTARCACMRKLLLILRSMVVDEHPYYENFFKSLPKKA